MNTGPWKVDHSLGAVQERERAGMYQIINKDGSVVAETMSEESSYLIAAAPDLLEACKLASISIGKYRQGASISADVRRVIDYAIQKAEVTK